MKYFTRRDLVIALASAGVTSAGGQLLRRSPARAAGSTVVPTPASAPVPEDLEVLDDAEYLALVAACDRVYPRDDTPGAADLGVARYIDRALARSHLPPWSDGLRTGLARLDAECFERFRFPFFRTTTANQDTLLADWATEDDDDGAGNASFVSHLVTATLEGVLGDPIHGGNRNGEGWTALGIHPDVLSPLRLSHA